MKNRIGVILLVLVLVCAGLGIALITFKKQATDQEREFTEKNGVLSNSLVQTSEQFERQKQVNTELESDRAKRKQEFDELTNNYSKVSANLSQVSNNLTQTEAALKASQAETAKRDAKITELEAQNQALDKQAVDLSTSITNLTIQIAETKRKLATSEGEKGFLEKELTT